MKDEALQDLADTLDEDGSFPNTVQAIRAAIAATDVELIARKGEE